ncbi:hypothetical protein Pcinc_038150 [Petrolisthes cinctipes]|uniref:Uncharacterized protein n=1 Tax=Petrolisthes cinctipes TaxID=88211 RepID=A0AAE1BS60_PETCI|nr:hypothetical protein Pcinc_038150 [Petrolisthes cinctipes]
MLRRLRSLGTPAGDLKAVYTSFILPSLLYASPVWSSSLNKSQQQQLEKVQKRAYRVILGPAYTSYNNALTTLSLPRLTAMYEQALSKFGEGLLRNPRHRHLLPPDVPPPARATRHQNKLVPLRAPRTDRYRQSAVPTLVRKINT